jgi:hypothetical protein
MSSQKKYKLNRLLSDFPPGALATQQWLSTKGIYRQLANRYLKSGWLEHFGRGVYVRSGSTPEWFGGVYALQSQLDLPVHVGAYTSLNLKGMGHYLALEKEKTVFLFSNGVSHLPSWFTTHNWEVKVKYCSPSLFTGMIPDSSTTLEIKGLPIIISSLERAMFEVLYLTGSNEDIDYSFQLMESLMTLRPELVQLLLENCTNIKVKRLFLWMGKTIGHSWFKELDVTKINIGKGKRMLYKGGTLDPEYLITVPKIEAIPNV